MKISEIINRLDNNELDEKLVYLYGADKKDENIKRYRAVLVHALERFNDVEAMIISAPGRSEIGGNHTDHQLGRVLCASVNMDIIAVVIRQDDKCEYYADGFDCPAVYCSDLDVHEDEKFTTASLIRGTLAGFKQNGYNIGGFKVYSHSNVLKGSGISSSAAFEVLIGNVLNHLYNDGKADSVTIAKIGQFAENNYFMKPCGLMDQMACSVGGFVYIDFKDKDKPYVEKIDFDFNQSGYKLCIVDTKGDHTDLSDEYALMPLEMKKVANYFGKDVLSKVSKEEVLNNIAKLRNVVSDRCILRAIHFLNETDRVIDEAKALKNEDMDSFKKLVIASGYSSYMYLQNVYSLKNIEHQQLSVALCISEQLLANHGAYRVHGGGLAGTIQAFVPNEMLDIYKENMENIFGSGSCFVFNIRPVGGYRVI